MEWIEYLVFRVTRLFRKLPINRPLQLNVSTCCFTEYFRGFEKVEAVRSLFGEKTEEILRNLKVDFTWLGGYMYVDAETGHLVISKRYLSTGNKVDIYLDIIHELCHIKQWLEGKELFDNRYNYVDRPTEVEAYRYTVQEARRLGLSDKRICEYLKTEWMSDSDLERLAKAVGVNC